jgi:DNA-binding transcriptional ArsR family regulator
MVGRSAAAKHEAAARRAKPKSSVNAIDKLIHEPIRLGIVSALSVNDSLTFTEIKQLLDVTDGNLSIHSRKLEDAGFVSCTKSFEGRMPKTEYRLTDSGRKAFDKYLSHMGALIEAARPK